jgi:hypothetical protein
MREYYAVINNCNYFLQRVDTTIISSGKKIMLGEYALVKAIRAWTYLQLGLNYGKVTWLTDPVLNIDDMNRQYEELTLEAMLPRLILELAPYLYLQDYPKYGEINGLDANYSLIQVPVILAELLMWQGACTGDISAYSVAAEIYYLWFTSNGRYYLPGIYSNLYADSEFRNISAASEWRMVYNYSSSDYISLIRYNDVASENLSIPPATRLCIPTNTTDFYMIKPSQAAVDLWNNEIYAFYRTVQKDVFYNKGDLRGHCNSNNFSIPMASYDYVDTNEADSIQYIVKYGYYPKYNNSAQIIFNVRLYRSSLLYLRYAEALNALGKPSLAFAVLKYGMKQEVLTDATKVSPDEINPLPHYCDFMDERFNLDYNRGFHSRGCGNVEYDTIYYAFTQQTLDANREYYGFPEKLETKADSIAFVNVMICKELGLETAFEGNRFHDLMRLSKIHEKITGKTDFLSKWVARRNPALENKLANPVNWYLQGN